MPGIWQSIAGTIAVCERLPFWVPALQREFEHEPIAVRGCRTPRELSALISTRPAIAVCDVTAQPAECLNWFTTSTARSVPIVVCGSPAVAELEAVCRELGVRSFFPDIVPREELSQLCRRWLRRNRLSRIQ